MAEHDAGPHPRARRLTVVALVVAAALAAVLVAAVTLLVVQRGEALPGTHLAGVDVGGLGADDLRTVTARLVAEHTDHTTTVTAGGISRTVTADDVGLHLDTDASVRAALDAGRDGFLGTVTSSVAAWFGASTDVGLATSVEDAAVREQVGSVKAAVDQPVVTGGFEVVAAAGTTEARPVAPQVGRDVDLDGGTGALTDALLDLDPGPVALPVAEQEPGTTLSQAVAVTEDANRLLAAGLVLSDGTRNQVRLAPAELGPALRAEPDPTAGLRLAADEPVIRALVEAAAEGFDAAPRAARLTSPPATSMLTAKETATWRPRRISTSARGGRDGVTVDVDATTAAAVRAVEAVSPTGTLVAEVEPAPVSTDELAAVDQVIGTFTTSYSCCAPRARNIARMAELVDGTVVMPGKKFSLNRTAGERTTARGFYADGAIQNGELVQEVGGGVSQFSTTMFNAVWFAGLPSIEHQPHSVYISRYPPVREATLNWGSIDNVWRNDTDHPVVVRASTTSTSVTVSLYGHTGKRVVTSTTEPRQYRTGGGFRGVVHRTVTDGGKRTRRDTLTWTYKPPL